MRVRSWPWRCWRACGVLVVSKLTDQQWREVFRLRCKSKLGGELSKVERTLVDAAYREDEERYGDMEPDVFDATVPTGSSARWRR